MHLTTCALGRSARNLTRDTQAMHRTLKHDIPGHFLWSLPDRNSMVVQHDEPVHWPTVMPGVITRTHTTPADTPITGAPVKWAIIANPVKAVKQARGKRGKRTPLPPDEWKTWIERKLDGAVNIHTVDATLMPVGRGKRHGMTLYHQRVMYLGAGTVASQSHLAELQRSGIGPGKAYGCGLLIVQEAAA